MDEEQLDQATLIANLAQAKPEDAEHLGNGGCGHAQVCEGQHGEEQEHRLVQGALCGDGEEDGAVPEDGEEVHGGEGDRYPFVSVLHPRNALENEERRVALGGIASSHGGALVTYLRGTMEKLHQHQFK